MKTKKPKWGFRLSSVEGDVDSIIKKYRDKKLASNITIVTSGDKLPDDGFLLLMISKKKNKISLRQFGRDIDSESIENVFIQIVKGIHLPQINEKIGLA